MKKVLIVAAAVALSACAAGKPVVCSDQPSWMLARKDGGKIAVYACFGHTPRFGGVVNPVQFDARIVPPAPTPYPAAQSALAK